MTIDHIEEFPFKKGSIEAQCITADDGRKYSTWKVKTGGFVCTNPECGRKYQVGEEVNVVFWNKRPSNFVCLYCRGLFKDIE